MSLTGSPAAHSHQYGFRLLIDDFERAEFVTCGPLGAELGAIEIREGGSKYPKYESGLVTPKDIVAEQGVTESLDVYNWLVATVNGDSNARRTLTIEELAADGSVSRRWTVEGAVLSDVELGSWDNKSNDVLIAKMTIKNEGVTLDA